MTTANNPNTIKSIFIQKNKLEHKDNYAFDKNVKQ